MSYSEISNFHIEISDKFCKLMIEKNEDWRNHQVNNIYLVGYKEAKSCSGEFIEIKTDNDKIELTFDEFGAIPIYFIEDKNTKVITSNLFYSLELLDLDLKINENNLVNYFSVGYSFLGSKTLFKNIHLWQEPGQKVTIHNGQINREFNLNQFSLESNTLNTTSELLSSIKLKMEALDPKKTILLLSGGNDSLLCALGLKACGYSVDTATFGNSDSDDLIIARKRAKSIFPESVHHEFEISSNKFSKKSMIEHTKRQNIFGTLSNINYTLFLKKLKQLGYKYVIFGDYFEILRKKLNQEKISSDYLTPKNVVDSFFKTTNGFESVKKNLSTEIEAYYKNYAFDKFYLYDRTIKGCSWKNNICRSLSLTKVTFAFEMKFIDSVMCNFTGDGGLHNLVLDELMGASGISRDELNEAEIISKQQPLDPQTIVYENKNYFHSLVENNLSKEVDATFNLMEISKRMRKNSMGENDHWFILRLMNLLNFIESRKL